MGDADSSLIKCGAEEFFALPQGLLRPLALIEFGLCLLEECGLLDGDRYLRGYMLSVNT